MNFAFYDLETTGISPAFDQPLQFAAILTDGEFTEIDRVNLRCRIAPHMQRCAIEMDYGMEDGRAQIPVRRALLFYALKRLGLDTDPAARRPQDQQIVLLNSDDVVRAAGRARS